MNTEPKPKTAKELFEEIGDIVKGMLPTGMEYSFIISSIPVQHEDTLIIEELYADGNLPDSMVGIMLEAIMGDEDALLTVEEYVKGSKDIVNDKSDQYMKDIGDYIGGLDMDILWIICAIDPINKMCVRFSNIVNDVIRVIAKMYHKALENEEL